MFLYSLIVSVLSFAAAAELNRVPSELDNLNVNSFLILLGAIYVFVIGMGLAGYARELQEFSVPALLSSHSA
jgi:hypothetical protein